MQNELSMPSEDSADKTVLFESLQALGFKYTITFPVLFMIYMAFVTPM